MRSISPSTRLQRLPVRRGRAGASQGQVDLAAHQAEGCAQLVSGVAGEAALPLEGVVDARQHGIEGARQPA